MGRPVPMASRDSSTLHVFAMASTNTAGSRAMTGEMVLRNCLTGMADEDPPARRSSVRHAALTASKLKCVCH